MECSCGGVLDEGRSCYRVSRENFYFVIEDIPAFKCTRCGKILVEDDVIERIKKLVNKIERETGEIISGKPPIHTYDY